MPTLTASQLRGAAPLDIVQHNEYVVSVLPCFNASGLLPPGIHPASWQEVQVRFGQGLQRTYLLEGLLEAATVLRDAGAVDLWLGGSFVTDKPDPTDYDGAWTLANVDLSRVDPILIDLHDLRTGRLRQKAKYRGELLIDHPAKPTFRDFFQLTRNGEVKGIVLLDLRTLP